MQIEHIKRKSISGAITFFFRAFLLQMIGVIASFALSWYFSPEDFGIYGFVIQIIGILIFFSDIGLAATLIQKKEDPSDHEYQTAFATQQILSWLIVGIVFSLIYSGLIEPKVGRAGVWILIALGLSFPLASLKTIPSVILERNLDFSKLVIPQIVEQIIFYAILIYLAANQYGAIAYAYAILVRSVSGVVTMYLIQSWNIGLRLNIAELKSMLNFGAKFQLNDFLARIKDQLFFLVLGYFLPLREFGYVTWAKNWSSFPYNLTVANVMSVTFPTFSRLQHHPQALRRAIEKSLYFVTLAIFPIVVGMSVFIGPFVTIIPQYQKWQPAALSLVIFSLSIAWSAISTPLTNTLNAIGKIDATLRLMIMWTVATWIITPILVYIFGYNGVAFSALVIAPTSIIPAWYIKKEINFSFIDQIWRQALAAIIMGIFGFLGGSLWSRSIAHFLLGIFLDGSIYLVFLFLLGFDKIKFETRAILAAVGSKGNL